MIEIIEMHLPNYEVHISDSIALVNGKKISINEDNMKNIIRIIRNWEPSYKSDNAIEKEKYYIHLKTDKEESVFNFIGSFPDDFYHLTDFLGGLYVRK